MYTPPLALDSAALKRAEDFSKCLGVIADCRPVALFAFLADDNMAWFSSPGDNLLYRCLNVFITAWLTLLFAFTIVPAVLGVSFGIRSFYIATLLKIFEVSLMFVCCIILFEECGPGVVYPLVLFSSEGLLEAQSMLLHPCPLGVRLWDTPQGGTSF